MSDTSSKFSSPAIPLHTQRLVCLLIQYLLIYLITQALWPIERCTVHRNLHFGKRDHKGYVREALIKIDAENCPPDHLHLRRSLINRLLNQVIEWSIVQSSQNKFLEEMNRIQVQFRLGYVPTLVKKTPISWTYFDVQIIFSL